MAAHALLMKIHAKQLVRCVLAVGVAAGWSVVLRQQLQCMNTPARGAVFACSQALVGAAL